MSDMHTAYLALGSNLGDRVANIHAALQSIASFTNLEATSYLYQTPPAYVTDQPDFLNAVCRVNTSLSPHELLAALEKSMHKLGRERTVRFGPRPIDIDILFYDNDALSTDDLIIPHPRLPERDFVLEPLCDINPSLSHPTLQKAVHELWIQLRAPSLPRVMPIGSSLWYWGQQTYIMGILNVTPDSFSGDGVIIAGSDTIARAVAQAHQFAHDGADCLDIGGQSTRPGHELVSVEEEIERVVPVIQAVSSEVDIPISVDTFRAEVAEAVLEAGAHMINDIWALRYDSRLGTIAQNANVPLVLMHNRALLKDPDYRMRMAPSQMGAAYEYDDLIADIHTELEQQLVEAHRFGIPRWMLVIDPGMGFGKSDKQQLALIKRLDELKSRLDYPLLFGSSRKGFIGKVLGGLPPTERVEGTLATCVLAAERGADIVRVHDVQAAKRAMRMVDAIVRDRP